MRRPLLADECHAVLNTEVSTADSWALATRAAVLSLKVEQLNSYIQEDPENAWMAVCDPQRECGAHLLFWGVLSLSLHQAP